MRDAAARIIIVVVTLTICTAALEGVLRVAGRRPSNTTEGFFEQHGTSYRLRKNMTKIIRWPSYSYVTTTNSYGFRDKQVGDRTLIDRKYDVFIGNSAAFGNGVDYQESFVGVYEGLSTRVEGIEVLNLAVGGHRLQDQMLLLRDFASSVREMPRRIFICTDPQLISTINTTDGNIIVKNGYLFDRRAWILSYLKVTVSNISSVYCFVRDSIRKMQSKRLAGTDESLRRYLSLYRKERSLDGYDGCLDSITRFCQGIGVTPVFLYLPPTIDYALRDALHSGGVDADAYDLRLYSSFMDRYCRAREVEYIDLGPALDRCHEEGGILSFAMDAHYNEQASKTIGEYVFERMHEQFDGGRSSATLPLEP